MQISREQLTEIVRNVGDLEDVVEIFWPFVEEAQDFVEAVDNGKAGSVRLYKNAKAALKGLA